MNIYHDDIVQYVMNNSLKDIMRVFESCDVSLLQSIFSIPFKKSKMFRFSEEKHPLIIPHDDLTLIHIASFADSLESYIFLLKYFNHRTQTGSQYYPLHFACLNGSIEVMNYILHIDPQQIYECDKFRHRFLELAAFSGVTEAICILFHYNVRVFDMRPPISIAVKLHNVALVKTLLTKFSLIGGHSKDSNLIMLAIQNNYSDAIPLLIEANIPINTCNSSFETPLSAACYLSHVESVRVLCNHIDNIDIPSNIHAKAAVHWLCESKSVEIARIILDKNIDVNRLDQSGNIGPYYLIDMEDTTKHIEILELLYQKGIDLNKTLPGKNTLLGNHLKFVKKDAVVIKWLIDHGADLHAQMEYCGQKEPLTIIQYVYLLKIESVIPIFATFDIN